jgi:hypothetical protein
LLAAILGDPAAVISDAVSAARIRWELPRALRQWESSGTASYTIRVRGAIPPVCILDAELTVQDGSLVEVRARENPLLTDSPMATVDRRLWDRLPCPYEELTVERVFERVEAGIDGLGILGAPLTVRFDEEMGFIQEYRFGRASRRGVLGYRVSECCTWFEFRDLVVSDP